MNPGTDGYYLGGALKGYPNPNFLISGTVDRTHFNGFGGSNETDYGISGEYLFSNRISVFGGYSYGNFSPGSFHVSTGFIGIRIYNDNNSNSGNLIDRQRTGTTGWSTIFAPLQLRF